MKYLMNEEGFRNLEKKNKQLRRAVWFIVEKRDSLGIDELRRWFDTRGYEIVRKNDGDG